MLAPDVAGVGAVSETAGAACLDLDRSAFASATSRTDLTALVAWCR